MNPTQIRYKPMQPVTLRFTLAIGLIFSSSLTFAQQVTGNWKGRLDKKKVELKIIQNGDSLTGTVYYFESANTYTRYSIKGYFDQEENSVIWWDDQLLESKGTMLFTKVAPLLSVADFNCPGGGKMYLNGKTSAKEEPEEKKGIVDLTKAGGPNFPDEWDYVIDNYTVGANDPDVIDSVELIALSPKPEQPVVAKTTPPVIRRKPGMVSIPPMRKEKEKTEKPVVEEPVAVVPEKIVPLTIEEKFKTRTKVFATEIPVSGDSIELRFYDNAQIDGDSISLFLNDKLLFQHIRLTDKAYSIKLPVTSLSEENELTMVAENLGSIPPNTSYMVAMVGEKKYTANLASTENSSAVIRLKKEQR
jgi:hypothetical protein